MSVPLSDRGVPLQTHDERGPRFKPATEVYYFGCADHRAGHFWFQPGMIPWKAPLSMAAEKIDGRCAPRNTSKAGVCMLTYLEGWSILAWWDYSVDKRPGSNSALVAKGTYSFDQMMLLLNSEFPNVANRQLAPMILTGTE